jgi:outer membrane protein
MKSLRRMNILLLVLLLPISGWSQRLIVNSQNLKSLLQDKNIKIQSARYESAAANERATSWTRSFLPSLSLEAKQESFRTGYLDSQTQPAYAAEISVNLFNGWRDKMESEVHSLESQKKDFQLQRISSEELEKARASYWQSLYLQKKISLLKESLELNEQNLKSAQKRIRSGVATDTDRFEFEMSSVDLKREIAETELQLTNQINLLLLLIGKSDGTQLEMTEELTHDHDYEALLQHSLKQHEFLFKEAELQAQQLSLLAQSQRRSWWPKLEAFASYEKYDQSLSSAGSDAAEDLRNETVMGLKMTMNLGSNFKWNQEARAFSQQALASQAMADYQRQEIETHLKSEMAELKLIHDQVHEAEQNIQRAQTYYKMTQSEYSRGVKNSPDVLGASEKLFDRRHKLLELIKQFQISKSHILSKMGL